MVHCLDKEGHFLFFFFFFFSHYHFYCMLENKKKCLKEEKQRTNKIVNTSVGPRLSAVCRSVVSKLSAYACLESTVCRNWISHVILQQFISVVNLCNVQLKLIYKSFDYISSTQSFNFCFYQMYFQRSNKTKYISKWKTIISFSLSFFLSLYLKKYTHIMGESKFSQLRHYLCISPHYSNTVLKYTTHKQASVYVQIYHIYLQAYESPYTQGNPDRD